MLKKQTSVPQNVSHQTFVIIAGYILFAGMVIGLITGTIVPLSHIFIDPRSRHLNVAVFMVSLVVGALLPSIIGYFVGESGTRTKNRQLHHYNGILFAVLAYWVSTVFGALGGGVYSYVYNNLPSPWGTAIGFLLPTVAVAIVVGVLAVLYHRGRGRQLAIAEYRPFQITLFVWVAAFLFLVPLLDSGGGGALLSIWMMTAVTLGAIGIPYVFLLSLRITAWRRLVLAIIGDTIAYVTLYVASQFVLGVYSPVGDAQLIPEIFVALVSVLVWALYVYITRLSYRK